MRVRCSPGQLASMKHWGSERHREYLDGAVTVGNRRSVAMPPVAWATLANALKQEAFTKWGKGRPSKLTGDAKGTRSALHCVEKHLTALAAHPALRGHAVIGCSEQLMTVWEKVPLYEVWSLTPVAGVSMRVLYPEYQPGGTFTSGATFKTDLTVWRAVPWDDDFQDYGLFPEAEHLNW